VPNYGWRAETESAVHRLAQCRPRRFRPGLGFAEIGDGGRFAFEGTVGQYRALLGHAARLSAYRLRPSRARLGPVTTN
jgi:hypothetical protein